MKSHGKHGTRTYLAWIRMKSRCKYDYPRHKHYLSKGVSVCERWMKFEHFLADMGECPEGLSLDRINNDGNYEPGNCRWATRIEQARNTSANRHFTINGVTKVLTQWHRDIGVVPKGTFKARLRHGWPVEKALLTPTIRPTPGYRKGTA